MGACSFAGYARHGSRSNPAKSRIWGHARGNPMAKPVVDVHEPAGRPGAPRVCSLYARMSARRIRTCGISTSTLGNRPLAIASRMLWRWSPTNRAASPIVNRSSDFGMLRHSWPSQLRRPPSPSPLPSRDQSKGVTSGLAYGGAPAVGASSHTHLRGSRAASGSSQYRVHPQPRGRACRLQRRVFVHGA